MASSGARNDDTPSTIVTASLTTGIARVAHGMADCKQLVDEIFRTEHVDWETILAIGDAEFHHTKAGPFPNHQLRVSVQPATGYAALNYMDHDDPDLPIANSFNPRRPLPEIRLIFSGATGRVFPRAAAIPVGEARRAVIEWLTSRKRPTCIAWRPFDAY